MNGAEIDLALEELALPGCRIQDAVMPTYDTLALELYGGKKLTLLVCLAHGATRLHAVSGKIPKPDKPRRFMECLRSRARGAVIRAVRQIGQERVVRFDLSGREGDLVLWVRLWSGAANVILAHPSGKIIEAMAHRKSRGEMPGGAFEPPAAESPPRQPRDIPGDGSYNERLEALYASASGPGGIEATAARARSLYGKRIEAARRAIESARIALDELSDPGRFRELGDILAANAHEPRLENGFLVAEDFHRGGEIRYRLPVAAGTDPRESVLKAARDCYDRYRRAGDSAAELLDAIADHERRISDLEAALDRVLSCPDPVAARVLLDRESSDASSGRGDPSRRAAPGLTLVKDGWTIMIGRSSTENDAILRSIARGNDTWFHARDRAGAYVFVRGRKDKSVPLEIMIDAATLAIHYSKARAEGRGNVYYTKVKYLRRVKEGPKGEVIPTQEKNLSVVVDETRLRSLKSLIGA